jgi:hypothetical protein
MPLWGELNGLNGDPIIPSPLFIDVLVPCPFMEGHNSLKSFAFCKGCNASPNNLTINVSVCEAREE